MESHVRTITVSLYLGAAERVSVEGVRIDINLTPRDLKTTVADFENTLRTLRSLQASLDSLAEEETQ